MSMKPSQETVTEHRPGIVDHFRFPSADHQENTDGRVGCDSFDTLHTLVNLILGHCRQQRNIE